MRNVRRSARIDAFKAIADPTRRGILQMLGRRRYCRAGEIARGFPRISRPAVSRHLRVLRGARLVTVEGVGREQRYRLNEAALQRVQVEWFRQFTAIWDGTLAVLKNQVEHLR
jgi:DNA-binding transcriptional ArsR family regulator